MNTVSSPHLLWIARFDYRGGLRVPAHQHAFHQAILILGGSAAAVVQRRELNFVPGDFLWLPPQTRHEWHIPASGFLETLDMKFLCPATQSPACWTHAKRPDLTGLFGCLLDTALDGGVERARRCDLLLQALLLQAADPPGAGRPLSPPAQRPVLDHPVLSRMMLLFEEDLRKRWQSGELAKSLHLSYRRLSQLCLAACDQSPMRLLLWLRVRKACEYLLYSEWAVKEIADLCGFGGVHQFTRRFREVCGQPPAAWREEARRTKKRSVELDPGFKNIVRVKRSDR